MRFGKKKIGYKSLSIERHTWKEQKSDKRGGAECVPDVVTSANDVINASVLMTNKN